jgi:two-component system phosphate regulon sensor histidine kinase PhoR
MSLPSFLFGLILGLAICYWRQYKSNTRLQKILSSFPQFEPVKSLSTISLVRRTLNRLDSEYQNLQNKLKTYYNLLENAPIGYLEIDQENQLTFCNKKARDLLKIERWLPNKPRFFLELVRSFELDQLIQQTRKIKESLTIEWTFYLTSSEMIRESHTRLTNCLDNESLFLKAYSYSLPEDNVVIFVENKQALLELSHSRNRAFSDLSHELRTPLTSMSLLAEALLMQTEHQEKEWVEQMLKEINRLIDLVEKWLDISQLEDNLYSSLNYQQIELKQLIISAWQSLEILAEKKKVTLNYLNCRDQKDIYIEADLNFITQVFINLFDNAIKHSYEGGIINVKINLISPENKDVEINIIDSGTGFNSKDLPYIFERLYRGDKSRARTSRYGSGLGLAIVKEIIAAHHGLITAQNHPETGGAWVKITLPQVVDGNNKKVYSENYNCSEMEINPQQN